MLSLFDIVYCSDKAYFWTPYVEMGQTPECCSSLLFPEILGPVTVSFELHDGFVNFLRCFLNYDQQL